MCEGGGWMFVFSHVIFAPEEVDDSRFDPGLSFAVDTLTSYHM